MYASLNHAIRLGSSAFVADCRAERNEFDGSDAGRAARAATVPFPGTPSMNIDRVIDLLCSHPELSAFGAVLVVVIWLRTMR